MPNDRVTPGHPLHADRKHTRHDGRKAFRHGCHRECHTENQHIEDRRQAADVLDNDDCCNHHDSDHHDDQA